MDFPTPPLPLPTATIVLMGSLIFSSILLSARARASKAMSIFPTPGTQLPHGRFALAPDLVLQRTCRRREGHREADVGPVDLDVADEVQRDQVAVELGILDRTKRVPDLLRRHVVWGHPIDSTENVAGVETVLPYPA